MNYERNRKYFEKTNFKIPAGLIVFGLLLLAGEAAVKFFGLILIAAGGYWIYSQTGGRPTDSEIDQACAEGIANIKEKALKKLGLDEEEVKLIAPIIIKGYYYKNISTQARYKLGKDERWRCSNYEAVVLFFSERQVYAYNYRFSLINNELNESTDEYFYKDIVSVATSTDSMNVKDAFGQDKSLTYEQFKLTTSGGTSITCSIWDSGYVEKSIQGMKQLLREKKNA